MEEQKRQRFRQASVEELRQAKTQCELTDAEFDELYREIARKAENVGRAQPSLLWRTVLLVTALFGLGILIFCGGCGALILRKHLR